MKRFVIYLFLFIVFFFSADIHAQEKKKGVDNTATPTELTLSTEGNTIRVQNAVKNSSLEVYNILGVKITSVKIDSNDQTITLNLPKGCYILKIEEIARKIAIK